MANQGFSNDQKQELSDIVTKIVSTVVEGIVESKLKPIKKDLHKIKSENYRYFHQFKIITK